MLATSEGSQTGIRPCGPKATFKSGHLRETTDSTDKRFRNIRAIRTTNVLFLRVSRRFMGRVGRGQATDETRIEHGSDMVFSNSAPHRRLTDQRHVYLPGNALENATPTLLTSDKTTHGFCARASFCISSVFYPCFIRGSIGCGRRPRWVIRGWPSSRLAIFVVGHLGRAGASSFTLPSRSTSASASSSLS